MYVVIARRLKRHFYRVLILANHVWKEYGLYIFCNFNLYLFSFTAGYISLTSIILVEFLGLEKLTNAFGLTILFRGAASLVGSPIAGTLYDMTKSYNIPFFVGGALFALSGLISATAPLFKKKDKTDDLDGEQMAPINVKQEKNWRSNNKYFIFYVYCFILVNQDPIFWLR